MLALIIVAGNTDRQEGNKEGWYDSYIFKTMEEGTSTHVYAAFSPQLKGK